MRDEFEQPIVRTRMAKTQHSLEACNLVACFEWTERFGLHNLLEAVEGQLSSWKIRLPNSLVAALFIQCQSSRIAGVGVKPDARETALSGERLCEIHQASSCSALLELWSYAQAVNDERPATPTSPRQRSVLFWLDIH